MVRLVDPAARAWKAMHVAALAHGHVLKISHTTNSYRPYTEQERIFRDRYYPSILGTRYWQGRRWRKRTGVAVAAVPGTSNHGWGLAVDIGEESDGDLGTESISTAAVQWLVNNAHRFGYSGELQSEPWHWRYFAGDQIPTDVVAFEHVNTPILDTEEDDDMPISIAYDQSAKKWRVFVTGEGSTLVDNPQHWVDAIKVSKSTGFPLSSPYLQDLIDKCRAER